MKLIHDHLALYVVAYPVNCERTQGPPSAANGLSLTNFHKEALLSKNLSKHRFCVFHYNFRLFFEEI